MLFFILLLVLDSIWLLTYCIRLLCRNRDLRGGEGFDVEAGDAQEGAAKHGELDQHFAVLGTGVGGSGFIDAGGGCAGIEDLSFEAAQAAADYAHAVASAKRTVYDAHGAVGVAEDEAKGLHLALRDCGGAAFGADGAVGHETFDKRICHYATTLRLAAVDEHGGADHYLLAPDAAAAPEHSDVALGGYIAGMAQGRELVAHAFLAVVVHHGYVPSARLVNGIDRVRGWDLIYCLNLS